MRYQSFKRKTIILNLLELGQYNNVEHLSNKLGVSCRTIKRDIQELKDIGASIRFCKQRNSYILEKIFNIEENLIKCL